MSMITTIDTNILMDILIPNSAHLESSVRCLMDKSQDDYLIA
jgi:hypothetical protein